MKKESREDYTNPGEDNEDRDRVREEKIERVINIIISFNNIFIHQFMIFLFELIYLNLFYHQILSMFPIDMIYWTNINLETITQPL